MHPITYRNMIERAVAEKNEELLDQIAHHLCDCEQGKQILRSKGYGQQGMGLAATVKLVPTNRIESLHDIWSSR